jgi:hypothetical protein
MTNVYLKNSIIIHEKADPSFKKILNSKKSIIESSNSNYNIVNKLINENKVEDLELTKSIINTKNYFEALDFERHKEFLKICLREYKNDNYDVKFTIAQDNPNFHKFLKTLSNNFSYSTLSENIDNLNLDYCKNKLIICDVLLETKNDKLLNINENKIVNENLKINKLSEQVLLVEFKFSDWFKGTWVGKKLSSAATFLKNIPTHIRFLTVMCTHWLNSFRAYRNFKKTKNIELLLKFINSEIESIEKDLKIFKKASTPQENNLINKYKEKIQAFILNNIKKIGTLSNIESIEDLIKIIEHQGDPNLTSAGHQIEKLATNESRNRRNKVLYEALPPTSFSPLSTNNFGDQIDFGNQPLDLGTPKSFTTPTELIQTYKIDQAAKADFADFVKKDKVVKYVIVFTGDGEQIVVNPAKPDPSDVKKLITSEKPPLSKEPLAHKLGPDFFGELIVAWLLMYTLRRLIKKTNKSTGYTKDDIETTRQNVKFRKSSSRNFADNLDDENVDVDKEIGEFYKDQQAVLPTGKLKIKHKWCYNCGTKNPAAQPNCGNCGADLSKQWFTGLGSFFSSGLSGFLRGIADKFRRAKNRVILFLHNQNRRLENIASDIVNALLRGLYEINGEFIQLKLKFNDNIIMPLSLLLERFKFSLSNWSDSKRLVRINDAEALIEELLKYRTGEEITPELMQQVVGAFYNELSKGETKIVVFGSRKKP